MCYIIIHYHCYFKKKKFFLVEITIVLSYNLYSQYLVVETVFFFKTTNICSPNKRTYLKEVNFLSKRSNLLIKRIIIVIFFCLIKGIMMGNSLAHTYGLYLLKKLL